MLAWYNFVTSARNVFRALDLRDVRSFYSCIAFVAPLTVKLFVATTVEETLFFFSTWLQKEAGESENRMQQVVFTLW